MTEALYARQIMLPPVSGPMSTWASSSNSLAASISIHEAFSIGCVHLSLQVRPLPQSRFMSSHNKIGNAVTGLSKTTTSRHADLGKTAAAGAGLSVGVATTPFFRTTNWQTHNPPSFPPFPPQQRWLPPEHERQVTSSAKREPRADHPKISMVSWPDVSPNPNEEDATMVTMDGAARRRGYRERCLNNLANRVLKAQLVNLTSRLRSLEVENSSLNKANTTLMAENKNLKRTNAILVSDMSALNGELTGLRETHCGRFSQQQNCIPPIDERTVSAINEKVMQADKFERLDRKNNESSPPMSEADLTLVDRFFATQDFEFRKEDATNLAKNSETKGNHPNEQHRNVLNLASISTSPPTALSFSFNRNTNTSAAATAKVYLHNVRVNRPRSRTYPIPTPRRIGTKTQQPICIPSVVKQIHKPHVRSSTLSPSDSASPSTSMSMVSNFSASTSLGSSFKDKDNVQADDNSKISNTMKLKSKLSEDQVPGSENEKGVSTPPPSPTPHLRISPTLGISGSPRTQSPSSSFDFVKPLSLKPQKSNVTSPTRVARAVVPVPPISRPPRSPHRPPSTLRTPLHSPARKGSRSTSRTRNASVSSTTNTPAKKRPALHALDVNVSRSRPVTGLKGTSPQVKPLRPKLSAKDLGKRCGVIMVERLQGLASPTKGMDVPKTSPTRLFKDVTPSPTNGLDSSKSTLASASNVSTHSLQTELVSVDSMCSVVRTDGHSSDDACSDMDGDGKTKDVQLNVKRHDQLDSGKQSQDSPEDMAPDNAASAKLCSSVLASLERICAAFSGSDLGSLEMTISEESEGVVEEDVFESAVVGGGGGAKKAGEEQSQTVGADKRRAAVAAESAGVDVDEDSEDQEGDETLRITVNDLSRTVGLSRSLSGLPQIRRALMLESECGDSEEEDDADEALSTGSDLDLDLQLTSTTKQGTCRPSTPATKSKSRTSVRSVIWSAAASGSTPRRATDLSPAKLLAYDKHDPSALSSSSSSSTSLASRSSSSDASEGSPTTFSPRVRRLSRSQLQLPPMVLGSTAPRVGHVACASPPRPSHRIGSVERAKIGGSRSGVSPRSKDPASSPIARLPRSLSGSSYANKLKTSSPGKVQIKTSPKKTAPQRSPPRKSAIASPRPVIFPLLLQQLLPLKNPSSPHQPPCSPHPAPETQVRSQAHAQTKPRSHTVNTISPLPPALSTPSQQALDDAAAAKKPRSNTVNTYSPVRSSPLAQSVVNAVRASRDSMGMRMRGKPGSTAVGGAGRSPGEQVQPVGSPATPTVPSPNTSPSVSHTAKGGTAPLRIAKKTTAAQAKPSTPASPSQVSPASSMKKPQPPATSHGNIHLDAETPPTAAFMQPKASAPSKNNIRTKRMTNSIAPLIPNWSPGAAPARCKGIFRNSLSMVR
ncbi:hypothetical protein NLJ89_g8293 [Agrocybe chaxingu]|uniref:Uncharacterized protein n=1 Tax=Agrocybe chaxingu TaxID=84603 RepID=A0A9W8JV62_9AGAR|nr:hypothetical protein NLJ89_g8293 [Agrocybe chaxingu]